MLFATSLPKWSNSAESARTGDLGAIMNMYNIDIEVFTEVFCPGTLLASELNNPGQEAKAVEYESRQGKETD